MLWRILAVWLITSAALVACLISGSEIAVRLHSAPVEMRPKLVDLAVGRAERTGLAYALLASLIDLVIFLPYGPIVANIVFVSAALLLGFMCWIAVATGFGSTLQWLWQEEFVEDSF